MGPWHLPETHDLVRKQFGRKQELLVHECTRSIVDRQNFGRFHYHEVRRLAKSFERKHLPKKSLIDLHASDELSAAFERFIVKAGAHATACVQSVHAIPDILANTIYYGCGLNIGAGPIPEHKVSVNTVVKALKSKASSKALAETLAKTVEGMGWDHLAAISNMSKHRSVIRSSLSEDWTGKRKNRREVQFAIFERGDKQYWSKSVEDTIRPEYDRLSVIVIETGHELNRWLREAAA
jgi:hypothetical protein